MEPVHAPPVSEPDVAVTEPVAVEPEREDALPSDASEISRPDASEPTEVAEPLDAHEDVPPPASTIEHTIQETPEAGTLLSLTENEDAPPREAAGAEATIGAENAPGAATAPLELADSTSDSETAAQTPEAEVDPDPAAPQAFPDGASAGEGATARDLAEEAASPEPEPPEQPVPAEPPAKAAPAAFAEFTHDAPEGERAPPPRQEEDAPPPPREASPVAAASWEPSVATPAPAGPEGPQVSEDQIWSRPEDHAPSPSSSQDDAEPSDEEAATAAVLWRHQDAIEEAERAAEPQPQPAPVPSAAPAAAAAVLPADTATPSPVPARRELSKYLRRAARAALYGVIGYSLVVLVLLVVYRWIDPPFSNLMLTQRLVGWQVEQRWVPLTRISPNLVQAVILSEDGAFCRHSGVDWMAMEEAIEEARGGSTITMQVVKNLFLWSSRSYIRKAIEIPLALLMEVLWPKQRILEVYLNIAEWGDGVFGVEVAARHHFGKRAAQLSAREAALLAVSLPNPIDRQAGDPGAQTRRLASNLLARMRVVRTSTNCLRPARFGG